MIINSRLRISDQSKVRKKKKKEKEIQITRRVQLGVCLYGIEQTLATYMYITYSSVLLEKFIAIIIVELRVLRNRKKSNQMILLFRLEVSAFTQYVHIRTKCKRISSPCKG